MSDLDMLLHAAVFPPADVEHWRQQVLRDLRGRALETLNTALPGGLQVRPLYTAADRPADIGGLPGEPPYLRGATATGGWDLCLRWDHPRREGLAEALRDDLQGGATGAWLRLDRRFRLSGADGDVGVDGAALYSVSDLEVALTGQDLSGLHLRLDAGVRAPQAADLWMDLAARRGQSLAGARLRFCFDPAGALARDGALPADLRRLWAGAAGLVRRCEASLPAARALLTSTEAVHSAGADAPLELAVALGGVVEALDALSREGLSWTQIARQMELSVAMDRDLFLNVAKLRALRVLWSHLLESSGLSEPPPPDVHAFSAPRTLSRRDPWGNIVRVTTQVFAAMVGGAQRITPAAFDEALGQPAADGRRLARNTALILASESHLGAVLDPAGGSYYVESLTDALVSAGWTRFQQLYTEGGLISAMRSGWLHEELRRCWRSREAELACRVVPVTGVSEYPHLEEPRLHREQGLSDAARAARLSQGIAPPLLPEGGGLEVEPLPRHRDAALFEALRDRADAAPTRPVVFLATLGARTAWMARATFASNLLSAGGIAVQEDEGTGDADPAAAAAQVAARFRASGARGVCLCGTDEAYQTHGATVVQALRAVIPEGSGVPVLLAGRPQEPLRAAGVEHFIHLGGAVHPILSALLTRWGM